MILFKKYNDNYLEDVSDIFNEIIEKGTSFPWDKPLSKSEVKKILSMQMEVYCVFEDGKIAGFYLLSPNILGRCSHIANATYAVKKEYRNKGIGTKIVMHSLETAKKDNFKAMQFNGVVSINTPALKVYKKCGFETIGTIKEGFRIPGNKYVDIFIMYKKL